MKVYSFNVPGAPKAKGRPRRGRNGVMYTPDKTVETENRIYLEGKQVAPEIPPSGAIQVEITFCFAPPSSFSDKKKRRAIEGLIQRTQRPDLDNMAKAVLDALNGLFWVDDAQIDHLKVIKKYAEVNETQITIVTGEFNIVATEEEANA